MMIMRSIMISDSTKKQKIQLTHLLRTMKSKTNNLVVFHRDIHTIFSICAGANLISKSQMAIVINQESQNLGNSSAQRTKDASKSNSNNKKACIERTQTVSTKKFYKL